MEGSFSSRSFCLDGLVGQDTRGLLRSRSPEFVGDAERRSTAQFVWGSRRRRRNVFRISTQLSVILLPHAILKQLVRVLFSFLCGGKAPKLCQEICYLMLGGSYNNRVHYFSFILLEFKYLFVFALFYFIYLFICISFPCKISFIISEF